MPYYITYGEFQKHLKDYYTRTGNRLQFTEMSDYLYKKGLLQETNTPSTPEGFFDDMTDDEFEQVINSLTLTLSATWETPVKSAVQESDIIPLTRDVFVIRHPRYTRPQNHMHNYFEINYVAQGQCNFIFEKVKRIMHEGELCIIAPSSEHDIIIEDDSTVFTIIIRKSTFDTTFFSLLSRRDLLSYFFRTILQDDSHANYLLFFAADNVWLKKIIRNLIGECNKSDSYSNHCCINWVNLLFSSLLRNYSKTIQFYNYQLGSDFSLVLQYIQHNYQALSLSALAKLFHYSEPHLCTLIKQNTGYTFTNLIKRLRMADAVDYLLNTDLKVSEIAEKIGYNSADHFSRVFRATYKISPQEYKKKNKKQNLPFVPFSC
ncbi:AraC family transcriptional regulator [Lachnotalea glycerini]|uniref:AraC family transcriptional regulator n=1 Tax=Lachnotalea glycerini TaxID=1763509 RepID=A0A371JG01_9FIRM|nr:AraC family transcriptional regulator [Lachnotalea glycerini]RDY31653.1 AraC family transcriptional regulator [Lachnotalea glycerini]